MIICNDKMRLTDDDKKQLLTVPVFSPGHASLRLKLLSSPNLGLRRVLKIEVIL